ncbi:hypothetical protein ACQCVP_16640 [Rossellomorea vietnamensis]|uniref:hypothetical protein n=1 Tax=Rossellomorea vietnamensis TaxID=218284 RepID=UPI003CEE2D96
MNKYFRREVIRELHSEKRDTPNVNPVGKRIKVAAPVIGEEIAGVAVYPRKAEYGNPFEKRVIAEKKHQPLVARALKIYRVL